MIILKRWISVLICLWPEHSIVTSFVLAVSVYLKLSKVI